MPRGCVRGCQEKAKGTAGPRGLEGLERAKREPNLAFVENHR